jgi:hypothetical protein
VISQQDNINSLQNDRIFGWIVRLSLPAFEILNESFPIEFFLFQSRHSGEKDSFSFSYFIQNFIDKKIVIY